MEKTIVIDAMGERCPVPVVRAKKALDGAGPGSVVEVHVDNDIAVQNLMKLARSQGCPCRSEQLGEKAYCVAITVGPEGEAQGGAEDGSVDSRMGAVSIRAAASRLENGLLPGMEDQSQPREPAAGVRRGGFLVMVGTDGMGSGNDELGKMLMKGYLFALSELERMPDRIIFYNGGVSLTTKDSPSIEDLKAMEAQGVRISSCGTCVDFYGLKDRIGVGDITNMYDIVEAVSEAEKVVRV